jgi:sortase B
MRNFFRIEQKFRERAIVAGMLVVFMFSIFKLIDYRLESRSNGLFYDQIREEKISTSTEQFTDENNRIHNSTLIENQTLTPGQNEENNSSNESVTPPTKTPAPKFNDGFQRLLERNKDTVGWITIPGTKIDYPVVQSADNDYYLNRNFDRDKTIWGAIFMDYRNSIDEMGRHTILYGHNMNDGSMFAGITRYAKPEFFKRNAIIQFDTLHESVQWEVFAAYETSIDFYFIQTEFRSKRDYADFLDSLVARSIVESNVKVTSDDQILTLSTCARSSDENRFVVHARRI